MSLTRLATYGTLAPGRVNNHQLDGLVGNWFIGTIWGTLHEAGWGAEHGFPGLKLSPKTDEVEVFIFQSDDLPDHWERLDAFEGAGYKRVVAKFATNEGEVEASIYVLA